MSSSTGAVRARASRPRPHPRGRLSVVPSRASTARSGPFVMLVAAILVLGLVGLLLLNLSMQKASFRLAALQDRAAALQTTEQSLDLKVDRLSSSNRLSDEAIRMGMVPNPNPVFLDLSDGSVVGDPTAARPRAVPVDPVVDERTTPEPSPPSESTTSDDVATSDDAATDDSTTSGDDPATDDTSSEDSDATDPASDAGGRTVSTGPGR
jgi:type II secretory pathway pseudopilin PulG